MSNKQSIRKPTNKLKTLDLILIILGAFMIAFVVTMIITFWKFQSVPEQLIIAVMGSGSSELLMCCIIECVKKKAGVKREDPSQYM